MAGFAEALILILTIVVTMLTGTITLTYLGSVLLSIVEQTSAGNDEVVPGDEPFIDKIGGAVRFLWLMAAWVVPAGFVIGVASKFIAPGHAGWLVVAAVSLCVWLLFPISLLSSLSAGSPWVLVSGKIIAGMLRKFPATLGVYFVSFFLVGGSFGLIGWACISERWWMAPVAGVVAATCLMIYARLLGRFAWVISADAQSRAPKRQKSAAAKAGHKSKKARKSKVEVNDPLANAPEKPKPSRTPWGKETEPGEGYGLAGDTPVSPPEEKKKPRQNFFPEEDAETPYDMGLAPEPPPEHERERLMHIPEPDKVELNRGKTPPLPAHPLLSGVYTSPWNGRSIPRWIFLCLALSLMVFIVQFLIEAARPLTGSGDSQLIVPSRPDRAAGAGGAAPCRDC